MPYPNCCIFVSTCPALTAVLDGILGIFGSYFRIIFTFGSSTAQVADVKEAPEDFVLWKSAKPSEPSWESPWGPGSQATQKGSLCYSRYSSIIPYSQVMTN